MYDWQLTIPAYMCRCRKVTEKGVRCSINNKLCSEENCRKLVKEVKQKKYTPMSDEKVREKYGV